MNAVMPSVANADQAMCERAAGRSASILLVEDDPALAGMLRSVLEQHGLHVMHVDNGADALRVLQATPAVEVVLLDLGLPPFPYQISEGINTLKAIHAEILPVKVIVLTGQDEEQAALEAVREGAFDFLPKPAPAPKILDAITRCLLFLRKEQRLEQQGVTRIAINAQLGEGLKSVRDSAEGRVVRQVLRETGFNVYRSAKRLGVKRENVYYLMKKYGIARDD
ncbi:response regulator [Massilia oculi]|uniref:Response regulator n=1 Tax=Massilia hydrophila TaxID=3044279 RepID=A0ABS7YF26_9BURK|nr:response regulator [Massilia oculi]MCA1857104.1 response regulator [Massilia oculi]